MIGPLFATRPPERQRNPPVAIEPSHQNRLSGGGPNDIFATRPDLKKRHATMPLNPPRPLPVATSSAKTGR